jgi:hypothetical protein
MTTPRAVIMSVNSNGSDEHGWKPGYAMERGSPSLPMAPCG